MSDMERRAAHDAAHHDHDEDGNAEHHEHHGHGDNDGHDHREHHGAMVRAFRCRFWVTLVLTVPILAYSDLVGGNIGLKALIVFPGTSYLQFVLATVVFLFGGWPFLKGLVDELDDRKPGMMTLIGLAVTVAYVYSSLAVFTGLADQVFFWELATLIAIMLAGHWIEMRSVLSAGSALEELVQLLPDEAHRMVGDGQTEDVPTSKLELGDRVVVRPGERVPVDGRITNGTTSLDQSMLTGESRLVEATEGDEIIAGSVNGEGAITIEVATTGEDSYLSQVIDTVRRAQASRSRAQNLADRAAFWLTLIAITAGVLTLAGWLLSGRPFVFALERMVTVMVITCPHALGLAVPLVIAASTSLGARHGLLIRDRTAFEQARRLEVVVFDKTGTLTTGEFAVTGVVGLDDRSEDEVVRLAASLEAGSEHAIARGIVRRAEEDELQWPDASDVEAIPGNGVRGTVDGAEALVVSPGYLEEHDIRIDDDRVASLSEGGRTVVFVLEGDTPVGAVALADQVRDESHEAVRRLRERGVRLMMITGDAEAVARSVADELGLDDVFAEVLPDKKSEKIRGLRDDGLWVAMVGDGVNDAPALAEADLGIAIGAGTDVAMETADVVLVNSDPRDVERIVDLSRRTRGKMVQNLWWAAGYNIVAIPLAAGVLAWAGVILPPAVGAVVMSASTVVVAVNARLLDLPERATSD